MNLAKITMFVLLGVVTDVQVMTAQSDSIHVLASGGVKGVLERIQSECERTVRHKLDIEYNSTAVLRRKIEGGNPFDVVIGASDSIDGLSNEGRLAGSHLDISRVGIGIGARAGTPKPDISTPDSLKRVLLEAKSVTYGSSGASTGAVLTTFEKLGITDQMKAKADPLPGGDLTTGSVVEGKNQYVITLLSEILSVRGLELVGPLPAAFQQYVDFAVGISKSPMNPDADKITQCLIGPQAEAAYKAVGMEPITSKP
jgi:molybdate transport system substrate-binding protein